MFGLRSLVTPVALAILALAPGLPPLQPGEPDAPAEPPICVRLPDATPLEPSPEDGTPDAGGKYRELVAVVRAPAQDIVNYGMFCDYGVWDGDSWAGRTDLPPAFWVLHRGSWYLWASQVGEEQDATAGGRYGSLLRAFRAPADAERYGEFADRGYWDGTFWEGQFDLPCAYWVYWRGTWFLWGECREGR